jgi:hypothetical protein
MKALAEDTDAKAEEMLVRLWRAASPHQKLGPLLASSGLSFNPPQINII